MAKAISRISDLIIKHLKEELTADEYHELQDWIHNSPENLALFHQLTDPSSLEEALQEMHELQLSIRKKIDERMKEYMQEGTADRQTDDLWTADRLYVGTEEGKEGKLIYLPGTRRSHKKIWLYTAAASILVLFAGGYFWMTRPPHPALAEHPVATAKNDIAPGGDKAILTLANGSTIVLESAANGSLAMQGNSRVSKDKNLLAYTAAKNTSSGNNSSGGPIPSSIVYNTLTTPRAGQFRLILPDGSKVWLNNASSLRYPTSFSGKSREVALSGEAYFEVAKDAAKPFTVKLANLVVDVLGTSFNIMAYGDDPVVKTTLLTGKVSVSATGAASPSSGATGKGVLSASAGRQSVLSPGDQAVVSQEGSWKILKGVDTEEAIAWQRGYFHFTHENIVDVLRQLARWYDVELEITIPVPDYTFDGEIGRDLSLSSILRHLEKKDLHFQIDGKKLIVSR